MDGIPDLDVDSSEFRRILSHYPTGVCVVTAAGPAGPIGMVVGSFTSVSLQPPLVAFLPDRRSTTWPKIEAVGSFCVNVLAEGQREVCGMLTSKEGRRFDAIPHRQSVGGSPILDGVVAWIDCRLHAVHEAGDHFIAIGLVRALDVECSGRPMVFLRGGYGGARQSNEISDDAANLEGNVR
ncbi:flavin reductase family protein (plasmid) [Polymorphobacter sp. PAMC 29334]|uniref:flavin reductase family protein n=1 Tax=Polymorphobacter sp. PAMC 29334 TaxID=2862331 RepID=UPI001C6846C5|nr:flavin reductase family protein [Polymorphobacter sp. PAMC 29334]QYE37109.1 flavin reductase family protein [Polymorphobacter sp. PAMC 29334]